MRRTTRCAVIGAMTLSLAAGLLAAPAQAAGSFYDPPPDLPATAGALVRSEPMRLAVSVRTDGGTRSLPGTATRIMYRTTDAAGAPVASTGTYIEPAARWDGDGPRPLVTLAEGTQGQGDACAPSKTLEKALVVDDGALAIGYEIPNVYAFLAQGIAVVVTDYVGLGTTDRVHGYAVRPEQGHAVLDAARAARQVPGASVTASSPVGIYGYSQGGGAAAAAAELAGSYAPDVPVRGTYAGAPPADLRGVLQSIDGSSLTAAAGWSLNALMAQDPALAAAVEPRLSDTGRAVLKKLETACVGDAAVTSGTAFTKTSTWTRDGESLSALIDEVPLAAAAVDAQRIGTMRPDAPVQVLTGTLDDIVQHRQARQLALDWCALGANVTYVPVVQVVPTLGTGVNHLGPGVTRAASSQAWLVDRLEGKKVRSGCSAVPWLP